MSEPVLAFHAYHTKKDRTCKVGKMRWPGIEPGSIAWKATMLTITPPTLSCTFSQPHAILSLISHNHSHNKLTSTCPLPQPTATTPFQKAMHHTGGGASLFFSLPSSPT